MKILVTGGAGFIGSSICLALKKKYPNYEIIAFDNLKRRGSEMNLIEIQEAGGKFIHGDIRNYEDLSSVGTFDVLIEAAAEPSVMAGLNSDPSYVIKNNLYGSINCLQACLKNKAKIIFLSTSRVYPIDRIENAQYIEEKTRFTFAADQNEIGITKLGVSEDLNLMGHRSFYGSSKLSTELFIQEYAAYYNLDAAITRLGVIAGPRQMGKTDQGVVTLWMAKHYFKQSLNYIGYGGLGKQVKCQMWDGFPLFLCGSAKKLNLFPFLNFLNLFVCVVIVRWSVFTPCCLTFCSYPKVAISERFTVNQAQTLIEAQSLI